jgi:hypothetical protein
MARSKIKIMISSRCSDQFPLGDENSEELSDIRMRVKKALEAVELLGRKIFEVWINEDAPPNPADADSLATCLDAVRNADIFLCLYNGNAGWSVSETGNGICHDELMAAHNQSPGKVAIISIHQQNALGCPANDLDIKFQSYVDGLNLFRGGTVSNLKQLNDRINEAVREMALKLMHDGSREARKSAGDSGPALDWTRLNFSDRRHAMVKTISASLSASEGAEEVTSGVMAKVAGTSVLFIPNAIPSAFTVSPAREMVGQPFLKDHEYIDSLGRGRVGPVHVIGCTKNITEAQAMRLLGFPDATIVQSGFGIYIADNIQKIQMCLIAGCIDQSSTQHQVQRFLEWLDRSGEADLLVARAKSRAKIVKSIAEEVS